MCVGLLVCRGKPKIVDLTSERRLAERVTEAYVACGEAQRDEVLYCLLAKHPGGRAAPLAAWLGTAAVCLCVPSMSRLRCRQHIVFVYCHPMPLTRLSVFLSPASAGRTIVFVNAISAVRRLAAILKLLGLPAQALHAGGWFNRSVCCCSCRGRLSVLSPV